MKKRKWYVWEMILLSYSVLRYVLTFYYMNLAENRLDISILEDYEVMTFGLWYLVYIICGIGIVITFSLILHDLKKKPKTAELNYCFYWCILLVFIQAFWDKICGYKWDAETLPLKYQILDMLGQEYPRGHAIPFFSLFMIGGNIVRLIVVTIITSIYQSSYKRKKQLILDK